MGSYLCGVADRLRSGDLVVLQQRWNVAAHLLGIAIGHDGESDPSWLVLWTTGDRLTQLQWHLADALLVIDDTNLAAVRRRCSLGG